MRRCGSELLTLQGHGFRVSECVSERVGVTEVVVGSRVAGARSAFSARSSPSSRSHSVHEETSVRNHTQQGAHPNCTLVKANQGRRPEYAVPDASNPVTSRAPPVPRIAPVRELSGLDDSGPQFRPVLRFIRTLRLYASQHLVPTYSTTIAGRSTLVQARMIVARLFRNEEGVYRFRSPAGVLPSCDLARRTFPARKLGFVQSTRSSASKNPEI